VVTVVIGGNGKKKCACARLSGSISRMEGAEEEDDHAGRGSVTQGKLLSSGPERVGLGGRGMLAGLRCGSWIGGRLFLSLLGECVHGGMVC